MNFIKLLKRYMVSPAQSNQTSWTGSYAYDITQLSSYMIYVYIIRNWKPGFTATWYIPLLVPFILSVDSLVIILVMKENSVGIRKFHGLYTLWGEAYQHAQSSCWNAKTKYKMTHLTLVVSNHWTGLPVEQKSEQKHVTQGTAELVNGTRYHVASLMLAWCLRGLEID